MRLTIALAALAATAVTASPALAQQAPASATASANALAKGVVLQPLTLTKVTDLDFGTVVSTTVAGTVTIDADNGIRANSGGVTLVPSFPGDRGLFTGLGDANQNVTLTLTAPSVLVSTTNPIDTVSVNAMVLDQSNLTVRNTGSGGVFQVGVGGTFGIAAQQPNGFYKADFTLTADYQ